MKHNVSLAVRKAAKPNANFFTVNCLNKVHMIKAVRNATDMGLKEAKLLIEELENNDTFTVDTTHSRLPPHQALKAIRECGLEVERSDDPISLLRKATDMALAVDNVELAADILNVVRRHV